MAALKLGVLNSLQVISSRRELLRRLGLPETSEEPADWPLLLGGAGNPVGNLRVKEAAHWLAQQPGPLHGFTDQEVSDRADEFAEYLAAHGLVLAGSSGIQGSSKTCAVKATSWPSAVRAWCSRISTA